MRAKGNAGEHLCSNPPYGYVKDPNDKKKWIVDEEAAEVVKRIFDFFKSIFFVEEAIEQGSISQMTGNLLLQNGYQGKFFVRAVPNRFLAQASVDEIFEELGWTPQMLAAWVEESIG